MIKSKWQRFVAAPLVATLLMTGFAPLAMAADTAETAAVAQQVTAATEVNGTLTGGQFDKIWLGLTPENPGDVTVRVEWDRDNADGNGVGFFVLNPGNLSAVVNGSSLQGNNVGAGSSNFFLNGPSNVQGAQFRATGPEYTVVLFNDSAQDANFKLTVTNGAVSTDSDKVTAPGQATADATATDAAAATTPAATEAVTTTTTAPAATETTTETTTTTATTTATEATTATVAAAATATAAPAAVAAPAGPVRAETMEGSLPNQFDQHFLALEPSIRDGDITLDLTYDPQDNVDLARRINFWVLDQNGFTRYQDGDSPSSVAIAAGSKSFLDPDTSNRRTASFKATGFGPYTVIVQNNSKVPATYTLTANGGVLIDDSAQTITAQNAGGGVAATGTTTGTTTVAAAAPAATGTTTTTVAAGTGRAGEPGGTYTVASGDTLALIARDIYGDYRLYEQLCAFNNIADCNVIEVGQTINLPTNEQIGATGVAAAAATPAATTAAAAATPAATVAATTTATTTAAAATSSVTTTAGVTTTAPVTGTGTTTTTARPATTGTTTTTAAAGNTAASGNVLQALEDSGNYTILLAALEQAGLDSQLTGAGPVTVFAPTDAAFQKLLTKSNLTKEQLLQVPELSAILRYHVLPTKLLAADITNGFQATTLQGSPVTFTISGSNVKVNDSNIVGADVNASNGVIHSIDDVMLVNPG